MNDAERDEAKPTRPPDANRTIAELGPVEPRPRLAASEPIHETAAAAAAISSFRGWRRGVAVVSFCAVLVTMLSQGVGPTTEIAAGRKETVAVPMEIIILARLDKTETLVRSLAEQPVPGTREEARIAVERIRVTGRALADALEGLPETALAVKDRRRGEELRREAEKISTDAIGAVSDAAALRIAQDGGNEEAAKAAADRLREKARRVSSGVERLRREQENRNGRS
jgi:hypothetical protein